MQSASLLKLRIQESQQESDAELSEVFAAALLDASDKYAPAGSEPARTPGRPAAWWNEDYSPATKRKLEKAAEALRKEEERLEAARLKVEERAAAALREQELRAAAEQRKEDERIAAVRRREEQRAEIARRKEERRRSSPFYRVSSWLRSRRVLQEKQLRVLETVSLGEKRFVSLLQVEGSKFLIGGGSNGVALLTQLDTQKPANATQPVTAGAWQAQ